MNTLATKLRRDSAKGAALAACVERDVTIAALEAKLDQILCEFRF